MTWEQRVAERRRDLLDLILKAFETRGNAELESYQQSLLDDARWLIGPEDYPAIGVLESSVIEFSAETGAEPDGLR